MASLKMTAEEIAALVDQLKEPYRPVCRLCLLEERTPEEAARLLGRPVKTVQTQLYRGKRLLRQQLEAADEETREKILLAAKLSRQILDGQEVALP